MTGHVHPSFGAWPTDAGVRFRLWAPAASSVELLLNGATHSMQTQADGWHELAVASAGPGDAYRFRACGLEVPDPASRAQAGDVHGDSIVVDPGSYAWRHDGWAGRPWHEAVLYELHVGTFSPEGSFDGARRRLRHLAGLGITAIELMPIGQWSGARNWGYDGTLPFAPHSIYGRPDDLKALVDEAHGLGLMVFLDVVYNHFGPDGNYMGVHAPALFRHDLKTAWGDALDFRQRPVRDFFIQNALQWLGEYRFDGLRLDAAHAIRDDSEVHFLDELADVVHRRFAGGRHVHLVLENEHNEAHRLRRGAYAAQWNDDWHQCAHVLLTGEREGYYEPFADEPVRGLVRSLAEGFVFQGEAWPLGEGTRGEPSAELAPTAFVNFLQNHDQVGNRALGERLDRLAEPRAVEAMLALLLLSPQIPLLFMGEEWAAATPFLFFTDFHDELATAVRDGRRREFARFAAFADPGDRATIPDPNAADTLTASRLCWDELELPGHAARLAHVRRLLAVRRDSIIPLLPLLGARAGSARRIAGHAIAAEWRLDDGRRLHLLANLGADAVLGVDPPAGGRLYPDGAVPDLASGRLSAWTIVVHLLSEDACRASP